MTLLVVNTGRTRRGHNVDNHRAAGGSHQSDTPRGQVVHGILVGERDERRRESEPDHAPQPDADPCAASFARVEVSDRRPGQLRRDSESRGGGNIRLVVLITGGALHDHGRAAEDSRGEERVQEGGPSGLFV